MLFSRPDSSYQQQKRTCYLPSLQQRYLPIRATLVGTLVARSKIVLNNTFLSLSLSFLSVACAKVFLAPTKLKVDPNIFFTSLPWGCIFFGQYAMCFPLLQQQIVKSCIRLFFTFPLQNLLKLNLNFKSLKACFHYKRGKKHSLFVLLLFLRSLQF